MEWDAGRAGKGRLFDLDARLKVGMLAAVSILLTFAGRPGLLLTSILAGMLICLSGTPLRLYRGLFAVLVLLGFFYILAAGWVWENPWRFWQGHWSLSGIQTGLMLVWRLGVIFVLTRLFIAVTPPLEQGLGIAFFFAPLAKVTPWAADFSLLLTLTLRFIAMLKEEGELLWKAWIVQGGSRERGWKGLKVLMELIPTLLLFTLQRAEEVGENMMTRGYASGRYRVVFIRRWQTRDSWALSVALLFCLLLLCLNLT